MKINKVYLPLVLSIVLIAGVLIGKYLNRYPKENYSFLYAQKDKLGNVLDYIENNYVDSIDRSLLVEAAIPAIIEELDPHSIYIPAEDFQAVNETMTGNFDGIGITFNKLEDTVVVINPTQGGPSEMVGILPGDRIVKVNDTIIAGVNMSTTDIMGFLKGKRGTPVTVYVSRRGVADLLEFEIIRDKIPIYSVDVGYMIDDSIGYIKISRFAGTTFAEFIEKIEYLKSQDVKKVIIDVRQNTGGYMRPATEIANQFLSNGELIVYTQGISSPKQDVYAKRGGICSDMEVMIMQDEFSASASEILAGAIQDNDRGIIVGRRSFGKGLVQEQQALTDGSAIRVTIARYYTPTGRSIQKPFGEDRDDYYNDLTERYRHGEFTVADSIHFADSLKFYTPEGNVVYGGGGIMPDYFIPFDTTGISRYYIRITSRGYVYRFALEYADQNREKLGKFENYQDLDNYLKTQNLLEKFTDYATGRGVRKNNKDFNMSKDRIHTELRAFIVRNYFDNNGFFPIFHENDPTLQKAIKIFREHN